MHGTMAFFLTKTPGIALLIFVHFVGAAAVAGGRGDRLEIALRAVDPRVAVPYWDFALDGRLLNPADSIMWSNLFMGTPSGSGTIADGPLASWITPSGGPIRRQLGGAGALFTEQQCVLI
uniref:Tyrosinase_Cu-bd domain-containing protein n=1 Tax=Globodera pallida TaxID=36090 RepID=A0A183BKW9_GLOPA